MSISPEAWRAIVGGERGGVSAFLLRRGLWLARLPYGIGVWGRNKLYDWGQKRVERVSVPVVCIGNLTLGGTGKTPCVEYVARFFRQRDKRVAILSRGYGAEAGRNDEAMLLEENLPDVPHLQDRDRVAIARTAIEELESEVLVLDDGFQHRRLHRDLDVVLIDATNPWGYGYLFPRGALREPIGGLKRAHAVMITRADRANPEEIEAIRQRVRRVKQMPIALTRHAPIELLGMEPDAGTEPAAQARVRTAPLLALRAPERPVAAFCGIGNPEAFRRTLEDLEASVTDFRIFADHHAYTRADVDDLKRWAEKQPSDALIATTQKDFVKLRIDDLAGRPLWAVRIGLDFLDGQQAFDSLLSSVFRDNDSGRSMSLIAVLKRCRELSEASHDSIWTSTSASEMVVILKRAVASIESGSELDRDALKILFAPTGALQETSMANGWAEEYLVLSERFDGLIDQPK